MSHADELVSNQTRERERTQMQHRMKLNTWKVGNRNRFRGVCSCGAASVEQSTAGLCHGWHGHHVHGSIATGHHGRLPVSMGAGAGDSLTSAPARLTAVAQLEAIKAGQS